jgi:hypothetical protein
MKTMLYTPMERALMRKGVLSESSYAGILNESPTVRLGERDYDAYFEIYDVDSFKNPEAGREFVIRLLDGIYWHEDWVYEKKYGDEARQTGEVRGDKNEIREEIETWLNFSAYAESMKNMFRGVPDCKMKELERKHPWFAGRIKELLKIAEMTDSP